MLAISNQIESIIDWKYIGNGIGIAIAWVMKSGNKRDMKCDEDDHFDFPKSIKNKQEHAKPLDKNDD